MRPSRGTLPVRSPNLQPVGPDLPLNGVGDPLRDGQAPEDAADVARRYALLPGNLAEIRPVSKLLPETSDIRGILGVQIETSASEQPYARWNNGVKKIIPSRMTSREPASIAEGVSELLQVLGYSQQQLAEALGVSQSNVAKWKAGRLKPPGQMCALMSRLAPEEQRGWWLLQAGLSSVQVEAEETGVRWVPLLRDAAAAGTPRAIDEREVQEMLPFPRSWMPRGGSIFAIKVSGDSMAPILEDGYIALVDVASRNVLKLEGKMVAAREGDGVTLKWLRKQEQMYLLVPQNTSPRHPIHVWTSSDERGIVGEVVRWIGFPHPQKRK